MKAFLSFISLLIVPLCFARHQVHFSVINLEINKETKQFNYTIRLFKDDYIYLLGLIYDEAMHKSNINQPLIVDSTLITKYFEKAFTISVNDTLLKTEFIHQMANETDIWLSYKTRVEFIPQNIIIKNQIMLDLFLDQTNLVIIFSGNEEKGLTFDAKNTEQLFSL